MIHPLVQKLCDEFYSGGAAKYSEAMSSHWGSCSKEFRLSKDDVGRSRLLGYGFGESDRRPGWLGSLIAWLEMSVKTCCYFPMTEMTRSIFWGRKIVKSMGLYFGSDAFRQLCVLSILKERLPKELKRILVIGDGPGILSAFLHETFPQAEIILVDLGATLAIQAQNLTKAFPRAGHREDFEEVGGDKFRYAPAERISLPKNLKIDLAVNVASMQEMKPETIRHYFELLRTHGTRWFYCCNRVEKVMSGGEVARFADYPWKKEDEVIAEGLPGWYGWFLGVGGLPAANWGIFQLPLLRRYDGVHAHRFIRMASS